MTKTQDQTATKQAKEFSGVRAKLNAHREKNYGMREETLPKSGVKVEIPHFFNHGAWMGAQRQAKGDVPTAQAAFVIGTVLFEGEKLTMADVKSGLIDAKDMLFLINEVFGDDDDSATDEEGEGEGEGKDAG